jgi:hypothetical protein
MSALSLLSFKKIYLSKNRFRAIIDMQIFFPEMF